MRLKVIVLLVLLLAVVFAALAEASHRTDPVAAPKTNARLTEVMAKYRISLTANGRYQIPPITDKAISLTHRLRVIEMAAANEGIPTALLKAICWVEGWDRFTGERCQNWYRTGGTVMVGGRLFSAAPGEVVKDRDGNGLCAFQITLRWHPESDANRLKTDFTYCVREAARILVGAAPKPASPSIEAWEMNTRRYGNWNNANYWPQVRRQALNPPINPETGQPAW